MTADSSEKEAESRLNDHFSTEVRNAGGEDGDPSGVREGVERGRGWLDGNTMERNRDVGFGNGEMNDGYSGVSDLNVEQKDNRKDAQEATDMDIDAEVQGRHEKECLLTRDGRPPERTLSSEEDRHEETEDDFEEGDCVIAKVASKRQTQGPALPQPEERSDTADRSQHQQPEQQPPPQRAAVVPTGWESFLPRKQLRVLLAEDDDSTRHVVGALLRNCGYEVTSAANGMQAWEMLEDPNNLFDLVLTDVVMPCLSGVGLLTKIVSREAGKRIPVIMMSSHDSLDIVYRCLFKGAVDFLVKPVRKNELKNLWQHVWRCQSSSGSGSGSGMRKAMQPKSRVGSGNNSGSNDGSEDGSSGLNVRGGSDNGSGTQTVAVHVRKGEKQKRDQEEGQATSLQKASDEQMGQDLEMATRRPGVVELQEAEQAKQHDNAALDSGSPSLSDRNEADQMEEGYNSGAANSGGSAKAIDLIGGMTCQNYEDVKEGDDSDGAEGSDRGASNSPVLNDKYASGSSLPTLELSLKRPRVPGDDDVDVEERRAVRQSGGSAFSRYSTSGVVIQQHHPSGNTLALGAYPMGGPNSLSAGQSGLGTSKTGQLHHSTAIDRCGSSMGSGEASTPLANQPHLLQKGNGQDLGSGVVGTSGQDAYVNCRQVKDEAVSVSPVSGIPVSRTVAPPQAIMYDGVSAAYGTPLHPAFYSHPAAPPWATGPAHKSNRGEAFDHPPYREHGPHVSHHHSHHHQQHHPQHHHHHHHSHLPQSQSSLRSNQDDQTVTNPGAGAPRCGSSNTAGSAPDGNNGQSGSSNGYDGNGNNGSVNGSASGSNNLSNHNGQSAVPLPASTTGGSGLHNGESGSGIGATANAGAVDSEQNRFARREAALNKFRQKRKERCFEKKVRYQSRKRLAEQRPRVRGQFVRQTVYDMNTGDAVE